MDVTQEADVRAMALHLPPANIQNECFSERSHLMFCSYNTPGGITLSKTEGLEEKRQVHPAECQDRIGWLYRTV